MFTKYKWDYRSTKLFVKLSFNFNRMLMVEGKYMLWTRSEHPQYVFRFDINTSTSVNYERFRLAYNPNPKHYKLKKIRWGIMICTNKHTQIEHSNIDLYFILHIPKIYFNSICLPICGTQSRGACSVKNTNIMLTIRMPNKFKVALKYPWANSDMRTSPSAAESHRCFKIKCLF